MPWKIGGNFEVVATKCEENWGECAVAVATYVWCEMVSDVVDYLGREGMIWVLIAAIAGTILLRLKYRRNAQNVVLSRQILSKVGCKIHDLELKVNILTYKMQYGTWPLPHQIYSVNPRKLRKIRMTLSTPGDHNSWINHVLLSPMKNSMCVPYPSVFSASSEEKLTAFPDAKEQSTGRHVGCNGLTDYSSMETSKSTSDHSVNSGSQADTRSLNAITRESDCLKNENPGNLRRNARLPAAAPAEIECRSLGTSLTEKCMTPTSLSGTKCNSCRGISFAGTVRKCKSFLAELRCNDGRLRVSKCSPKTSGACSLKQSVASFATQNGDASRENQATECVKRTDSSEAIGNQEEAQNLPDAIIPTGSGIATFSGKEFRSSSQLAHVQSSKETLFEVKRRLQSLHNVLQTYQDAGRALEEREESKQNDKAEVVSVQTGNEIADQCKADGSLASDSSSSSLTARSSGTSKTYRCSEHNCCSQKSSRHRIAPHVPVGMNDPPESSTATKIAERSSRFYSLSRTSEDCGNCGNKCERDKRRREVSDDACKSDARVKIDENVTNIASGAPHLEGRRVGEVSARVSYVPSSSSGSVEDYDVSTRNGGSSRRLVGASDSNGERKRRVTNDGRASNDSDREEKSTALLLQEALHFKKVLLTRVDSVKGGQVIRRGTSENDIADESPRERREHFPSMILNIKTERPVITGSCEQVDQHYVYLEMKQRRDALLRSGDLPTLARRESEVENQDHICETSSKYFSMSDLPIRDAGNDDVKLGSDILSSLKPPPIYEKVVSIMIPVDTESREKLDTKSTDKRSLRTSDAVTGDEIHKDADDSGNVVKCSPSTRKLENLVLERMRNVRDYMDVFLQNQNRAIAKVRKALRYRDESDATLALLGSNQASHVTLHKRLIAITASNRDNCIDRRSISFSSGSSDLLLKTWPSRREVLLGDDVLRYCSNMSLRRNPEMLALAAPTRSEFRDRKPSPGTNVELKEKDASSISVTFERSHEEDATPTRTISELDELHRTVRIVPNRENDQISKRIEMQTRDAENKSSAVSSKRCALGGAETDTKIVEIVHEKPPAISSDNSTSNSSSHFTNATASSVKMDDVPSGSTLNLEQSHEVSIAHEETVPSQQTTNEITDGGNFIAESSETNVEVSELSSNLEYSSLRTLVGSTFASGESECDQSGATLNENIKEQTLRIDRDGESPSEMKANDGALVNVATCEQSSGTEFPSTDRLSRTHPRIKAKSDVSLTADRRKKMDVDLTPKKSLSFLTRHDSLAHIQGTLHQPHVTNVRYENTDKLADRSRPVALSQRASVRSCIPIPRNRLEPCRRVKHQTHARSPTRGPLTVSCGEKTYSDAAEEETVAERCSVPANRQLQAKEGALDLIEINRRKGMQRDTQEDARKDTFVKHSERTTRVSRDGNITSRKNSAVPFHENDVKSVSATDTEHSERKSATDGSKFDAGIITDGENATRRTVAVISILADEDVRKNYPASSFILRTENVCSATDFLRHKNKLWTITIERAEKGVTAKPSIADTCTSTSEVTLNTY